MPITKIKKVHYCVFCKKKYFQLPAARKHELLCFKNPMNQRACYDCSNLVKKDTYKLEDDWQGSTRRIPVRLFYCTAKQHFLYTHQTEVKGNAFFADDLEGDKDNLPMPKRCDLRNGFHANSDPLPF